MTAIVVDEVVEGSMTIFLIDGFCWVDDEVVGTDVVVVTAGFFFSVSLDGSDEEAGVLVC